MKNFIKKPIGMALSLAILVSSITCLSGISVFSASAEAGSLNRSETLTFNYEDIDALSAQWGAVDKNNEAIDLSLKGGLTVNNGNLGETIASAAPVEVQNVYSQYNIAKNNSTAYIYAKEGNPLYVDWQTDAVTSVEYTILTPALYGANMNYYFPIGTTSDNAISSLDFRAVSTSVDGYCAIYGVGVATKYFSSGYKIYDNDTTKDQYNTKGLINWIDINEKRVLAPRGNHSPYAAEVTVKIDYSKDQVKTNGVYNYYATKVTVTSNGLKISPEGHDCGIVNETVTATIPDTWGTASAAITDAKLMLPNSANTAVGNYYDGICIKNITINYTENSDKYVTDFVEAYTKVEDKTVEDIAISDKADVQAALDIYNSYDDTLKSYVNAAYITHLNELMAKINELEAEQWLQENYSAKIKSVKTSGVFKDDFSLPVLSTAVWETNYFTDSGYKLGAGSSLANINLSANNIATYYDVDSNKIPNTGGLNFSDDRATKLIQGKIATTNGAARTYAEAMRSVIKPEILPDDIQTVSGTFQLKAGRYSFLLGENSNRPQYPVYDANGDGENDLPTYGMAVVIDADGYVSLQFMYLDYKFTDSVEYVHVTNSSVINFKEGSDFKSAVAAYNNQSKALDMNSESVQIIISFTKQTTEYEGTSYTYMMPEITVSAGDVTISDSPATKAVYSANGVHYNMFPTAITGYSFGFTDSLSSTQVYAPSVWMDDIEIIGSAAPRANGASIKKTSDADKQDIRFSVNVAENSYIKDTLGYSVKNYGVVVALADALADKDAPLTMNSTYSEAYSSAHPVTKTVSATELPTCEIFVNIGDSAAGADRLGLRYIVRPFVTYAKDGEEDLIVYSTDDIVGTNGTCTRSIYSTGKKIAKTIQGKSGFVAEESYLVGEDEIPYATIGDIIDGTAGKSTALIDGTSTTNGKALLAFTAKHCNLIG